MTETRILIANRGEIAVRIMRTCREMGIPTVAVYSDADRDALHVEMADDAYRLGPAAPGQSYLDMERILDAARRSRATAVHPGYGFLSEQADFARAVAADGMTFIGPPPETMLLMGDKSAARRVAQEAGAPIVPGTPDSVTAEEAHREAERIGFPLVVKAAFGGGGKGMRLVQTALELPAVVERSSREAAAYFGRPEVYLERYLGRARHVEAQVLADRHGHVSFLGERDCTLQRRYQKLVEESPSPIVDETLRTRIGEAAVAISRAAGYENAGTVEFLVDEEGSFYFMEMNARLQVEHPVTEMVAGLDLVRLQVMTALGERVELSPSLRGHAIECRINAEDPHRDFLPGPGPVTGYRPPEGPFVRIDSGVGEGRRVAPDYDSLLAKVIVWGEDRDLARRRMLRALEEFRVEGIPTTIPFHQWVLETKEFREATAHTRFVEEALAAGALKPVEAAATLVSAAQPGRRPLRVIAEVNGHRFPVQLWGEDLRLAPRAPASVGGGGTGAGPAGVVTAPMQGTILQVKVRAGERIETGDTICILEAMKMENHVTATTGGTVSDLAVSQGDVVETGQRIAVIE